MGLETCVDGCETFLRLLVLSGLGKVDVLDFGYEVQVMHADQMVPVRALQRA